MANVHVAIVEPRFAGELLSGRKRIESRFTRRRRPPYGHVSRGDRIYFKLVGGGIIGRSRAARVKQFDGLTPAAISALKTRYNSDIQAPAAYWRARRDCRYAVLIWLSPLKRYKPSLPLPRQYGSGWLMLSAPAPATR